jgi:RHS repeat-associated protein
VGNILAFYHTGGETERWVCRYQYALDSNRLLATRLPGEIASLPDYVATPGYGGKYTYDPHGNMTAMPHLKVMEWDFKDQLHATQQQVVNNGVGEKTYYVYDAGGQRVRKVTETQNGKPKDERIYLGGFEVYRKYNGNGQTVVLERETLHVMDDKQRVALVETRTRLVGADPAPRQLVRFQIGNHLGSAALELDDQAQVISYEEYHPYGSTAYQAARNQTETPKRNRYTGKERDEETGFSYHGARYYAPWLGRWVSADPAGLVDGTNIYVYVRNNPVLLVDADGQDSAANSPVIHLNLTEEQEHNLRENEKVFSQTEKDFERDANTGKHNIPAGKSGSPTGSTSSKKSSSTPPPTPSKKAEESFSEWLHYQSTGVAFYAPPMEGDVIPPLSTRDTGSTALNLATNWWFGVSNLVAAGINTVGNLGVVADKGAKAVGFSDTDIQAFKDLTMTGELSMAVATMQEANALKNAAATARADLISSEASVVLNEINVGSGASSELNLATNLRTPLQFGHNAAGGTVGGVSQGFHQVGDVTLSSNPFLRQLQIAKGGFPTAVDSFEFGRAAAGGQYNFLRLNTSSGNAARAIGWGRILKRNPQLLGGYSVSSNSCTTVSLEILEAGGLKPPIWVRSPAALQFWFRLQGGQ